MKCYRHPFRGFEPPFRSSEPRPCGSEPPSSSIRSAAHRLRLAAVVRLSAFLIAAPVLPQAVLPAVAQTSLTYTFENGRITRGESASFYEFDVLAAASESVRLGSTQLYLNYPVEAFGTEIGANGKITITRGALTADDVVYGVGFADNLTEGPGKVSIFSEYRPQNDPEHGSVIGAEPAVLYQIRIEIADTLQPITLAFDVDCAGGPCMQGEQFLSDGTAFLSIDASDSLAYAPPVVNVAPEAVDDAAATIQDSPVEIPVLANDQDANGDSLQIIGIGAAAHGGASQTGPGTLTYTPAAGFVGSDSFTYTISDGMGGQAAATVTIVVQKANVPPVFETDDIFVRPEDGASITIGGTDAPVDPSETFEVAWKPAVDPDGGTLSYTWQLSDSPTFDRVLTTEPAGQSTSVELPLTRIVDELKAVGLALFDSGTFYHRVIASDGIAETPSAVASVTLVRGIVTAADAETLPDRFELAQNYPNPFNPSTTIGFTLPRPAHVIVRVFNTLGAEVGSFVNRRLTAGAHEVSIDASHLPSGVYLYRLEADDFSAVRKMVLMK